MYNYIGVTAGVINQQINLFQPIFRKERKLLSFRVLIQSSVAVLLLLVLIFGWSWRQTGQMEADLAYIQTQLDKRNVRLAVLGKILAKMKNDTEPQKELARLEQEFVARQKVVDVLTRVRETYTHGVSAYLKSFSRQAPKGVWLTGFSIQAGGEDVIIRGSSLTAGLVPVFIQKLSTEDALSGTKFGLLQIQREKPETRYVNFIVYTGNEPPEEMVP